LPYGSGGFLLFQDSVVRTGFKPVKVAYTCSRRSIATTFNIPFWLPIPPPDYNTNILPIFQRTKKNLGILSRGFKYF
jgi:hypothetical protein